MLKNHRLVDVTDARADAFDALTDLFLGEVTADPIPGCANSTVVAPGASMPKPPQPATPVEVPCDQTTPAANHAARQAQAPTQADTTGSIPVELMVLGHLPLMGSAWAGQYVRQIAARERTPVVIVRLSVGRVRVDVVDPTASIGIPASASSFAEAFQSALRKAGRVVVQAPASEDEPPRGFELCDRITLLTSSDEAGVVKAYGLLKRLAAVLTATAPAHEDAVIGVAAMGCDEQRAAAMWRRLQEAGQSFLGVCIEPAGCIERIDSGPGSVMLYDGPWAGGIDEIVELVMGESDAPASLAADGPLEALEHVSVKVAEVLAAASPPRMVTMPPVLRQPPAEPQSMEVEPVMDATAADSNIAGADSPTAAPEDTRRTASTSTELNLSSLVPGTAAIAARCPFDEAIQLAVDDSGQLHLLLLDHGGPTEHACSRLTAAAGWANLNAKVLALTMSAAQLDASRTPVSHLFTSSPAAARRLLDSTVRVHVVLSAAAAVSGWVSAEMN